MAGISKATGTGAVEATPTAAVTAKPERIKAFPFSGGTTIIIRDSDFEKGGVEHSTVSWDYRVDDFTITVGSGISKEAADYLTKNFPDSFKFV